MTSIDTITGLRYELLAVEGHTHITVRRAALAHLLRDYDKTRAASARLHDGLQRVGTALDLLAGADLTRDCVPAIQALRGAKVIPAEFQDAEKNQLPANAPIDHYSAVETARLLGFKMLDEDSNGDVYVCSSRLIGELVRAMKTQCDPEPCRGGDETPLAFLGRYGAWCTRNRT